MIADEAGRLQRLRRQRHRFAVSPQHVRQELVRVWQRFAFGPIVHHEEPSAHPLFRRMQGIAGYGLLNLRQQCFRIADEEIANVFLRWSHFLGQPAKVGSSMRMTDHEDAETVFI
jgi:hypothetical protein